MSGISNFSGLEVAVEKIRQSIRSRGLLKTAWLSIKSLRHIKDWWLEQSFDHKYNIDTCGIVPVDDLGLGGPNAAHAVRYEGIQIRVFRNIMRDLRLNHEEYVFIDFGSGKGRALMLASEYPFRKVIGVEMSAKVHDIASQNIRNFKSRCPNSAPIELSLCDAATYPLPTQNSVFFLYNPFGLVVIEKILSNLQCSLLDSPRQVCVVYRNPRFAELLDRTSFLRLEKSCEPYRIYRNLL